MKSLVKRILRKDNPYNVNTPKDLIACMGQLGGNAEIFIKEQQHLFLPTIVLNQVRSEREYKIGPAMQRACLKYFSLNVKFTGHLTFNESVRSSILARQPLAVESPECETMQQLKIIYNELLQHELDRTEKHNLLSKLSL